MCLELTPDEIKIKETHEWHTKSFSHHIALDGSWAALANKVNVNINTTNEWGKQGRDFYFHMYMLAAVLARHIPTKIKV